MTRHSAAARIAFAMMTLVFVVAPGMADPAEGPLSEEQQARLDARLEEVRERLELSDEQRPQVESLLRSDFRRRVEILQRHGISREPEERPGGREMRVVMRELKAVREETDAELARILDDRQLGEYHKIRQEAQADMRERLRSRSTEEQ